MPRKEQPKLIFNFSAFLLMRIFQSSFLLLIRFLWYKKDMIKEFIKKHQEEIILVIGVILISLLSFAMGYIVAKEQEKQPIRFEETGFIPFEENISL